MDVTTTPSPRSSSRAHENESRPPTSSKASYRMSATRWTVPASCSPRRASREASWRTAASSRWRDRAWPSRIPRSTSSMWMGCPPEAVRGRRRAADAAATNRARTASPRAITTSTERVLAGKITSLVRLAEMGVYLPERAKYTMGAPVDERSLASLLQRVADGDRSIEEAVSELRDLPFEDIGWAKIDHHRELRTGQAEAVYAPGKTPEEVAGAALALVRRARGAVFVTRAEPSQFAAVAADLPVAEEAALTASALGCEVDRIHDVGVAGVHRLLEHRNRLEAAGCLIVVAGMEGALPSVVAGLTSRPVVAVPTSVGYGASFRGLAALLTMLASCAPGISVVNIDNGFGAAMVAHRILRSSGAGSGG